MNPDADVIFVTPPPPPDMSVIPFTPVDTDRDSYTAPDDTAMADNVNRTEYKLSGGAEIPAGATIATAVTAIQADDQYQDSGSADQINAAYAYARNYTGDGIIVSTMGGEIHRGNSDIFNNLLYRTAPLRVVGYTADEAADDEADTLGSQNPGTCSATPDCNEIQATHLAGIIVATRNSFGTQGIAYDARIKPVDIITGDVFQTDTDDRRTKLNLAIAAASGIVDATACNGLNDAEKMTSNVCKTITGDE